jgi:hypothetical protein
MISPRLLAAAALAVSLTAGVFGFQRPGADGPLTLGVLREDGILLPFAAFDGRRWSTPWPGAIGGRGGGPRELPATLDAVPSGWWGRRVPSQWRLWPRDGQAASPLRLLGPAMTLVGEARRLGLRTDYRSPAAPLVPPFELPYPKAGLAVGGDATVEPIASVSRHVREFQQLGERLRQAIDQAEKRAIDLIAGRTGWRHPFDAKARALAVPEIEAWYTSALAQPDAAASYIEAVKKYPELPEDRGCGLESVITGWVHQSSRDQRLRPELTAVISYCDRARASYMLPLGKLRLADRTYWVYQMSGQDHEWYAVAELTPGRARLQAEYFAGSAPRPPDR